MSSWQRWGAKNDELTGQLAEAATELANQRQRLDNALNENASTFQAAEKERSNTAQDAAKHARAEMETLLTEMKSHGDARVAEMDDLLKQAKTTLDTIGVSATAGHYETYASEQKKAADRWRWGAIGALIVSAGVLAVAFFDFSSNASWHKTVLELSLSAALAGISGYAGSQSAGHRKQERKAQRFELGLKAMTSYLATSDHEKVDDLKVRLAAQLFIEDGDGEKDAPALPLTATAMGLVVEAAVKGATQTSSPAVR